MRARLARCGSVFLANVSQLSEHDVFSWEPYKMVHFKEMCQGVVYMVGEEWPTYASLSTHLLDSL